MNEGEQIMAGLGVGEGEWTTVEKQKPMDLLDVDHQLSMVREAAQRYATRRTVEVWERYFAQLESVDELPRERVQEMHHWAIGKYFEARNVVSNGGSDAELAQAEAVLPRAACLCRRLEELLA